MISTQQLHQYFLQSNGVVTDTRKILRGQIFFALKGPSFDGNAFAQKACEQGAAYAVIDDNAYAHLPQMLLVADVLTALQDLALYHRQTFQIPVLAISGSNGKTTTKELIHAVLSTTYTSYTTQGNLNNHIGVPLTLLSIKNDAQMAVVEMGANHQKEIESYCRYTAPTHGLVTNCGKAHLEGFGGIEGVRKGKGELFDYLSAHGGMAFAASDFDYFPSMVHGIKEVEWYGTQSGDVVGHTLQSEPFLQVQIEKGFTHSRQINTQLVGAYNVYNVLAAVTVGLHFGIAEKDIVTALGAYTPSNSRSQLLELNGNKIILDAYNANPSSMAAAIENFAALHANNKILLLGAMMELGETSLQEHQNLVELIKKYNWKQVILVGGDFAHVLHPFLFLEDSATAAAWWKEQHMDDGYLLIKGSRSMQMEKIIQG